MTGDDLDLLCEKGRKGGACLYGGREFWGSLRRQGKRKKSLAGEKEGRE